MSQIYISNNVIKKLAKRPLAKKILEVEIRPTVFPYYETCFRSFLRRLAFQKHHHLREYPSSKPKAEIIKAHLGYFKHLKSLKIPDTFLLRYVQSAKKLKNLQELKFSLMETQVPLIYNLFRNVNRLRTVKIILLKDRRPPKNLGEELMKRKTWIFLQELLRLQNLISLRLKIQECQINKEESFFNDVLQLVAKSPAKTFDIEIIPIDSEKIEGNSLDVKELLSQLTALRFYLAEYSHKFKDYKELEGDQKRLSLFFTQKENRDLSQIIHDCSELQELQIHSFNSKLLTSKFGLSKKLRLIDIKMKDAKDSTASEFMKYLANGLKDCKIQVFNFELNEMNEENLKEFVKISQSISSGSLKKFSFKMLGSRPWNLPVRDQENLSLQSLCPEMISKFIDQDLMNIHSLQVLKLSLNLKEPMSVKSIEPLFDQLVNLESFELVLYSLNPNVENQDKGSVNLNLLKMPNLGKFRFHCDDYFEIGNLGDFFESMANLKRMNNLLILCPTLESVDSKMISVIAQKMIKIETEWEYLYLGSHQTLIQSEMDKLLGA